MTTPETQAASNIVNTATNTGWDPLTIAIWIGAGVLGLWLLLIIVYYIKGLWGSPRELFMLYISKILEYGAYGAINLTFILYLHEDLRAVGCRGGPVHHGVFDVADDLFDADRGRCATRSGSSARCCWHGHHAGVENLPAVHRQRVHRDVHELFADGRSGWGFCCRCCRWASSITRRRRARRWVSRCSTR